MKRSTLLLLCFLLPSVATAAPAPAGPAAAAVSEASALAQQGKLDAALQRLEPVRSLLDAKGLSLLGGLYLQANRPAEALAVLRPLADRPDAEPAVLYNAGRAALRAGDTARGTTYLAASVDKDPASPAARDLGMVLARSGRIVEAYALLRRWTQRNPTDGDARLVAAELAIQLERGNDAMKLLSGLVDSPAVRLLRGRALVLKGDGAGALRLLQPVLAQHPPAVDLEVRRAGAEAYLLAGQPAKAVELLQGKAGNVPALVLLLARAQRKAGNAAAATATLAPLATNLPDDPATLGDPRPAAGIALEYGELLLAAGKTADAVAVLQKATKLNPESRAAWTSLASALDAAKRTAEAAAARQQAAKLAAAAAPARTTQPPAAGRPGAATSGPPQPAYAKQATELLQQKKPEQALEVLRAQIAAHPEDIVARTMQVQLLIGMQKFPAAVEAAKQALARAPNDANLVYQLGACEMGAHDLISAERDLRKALALAPQLTAAMNDLAVLLLSTGNAGKREEAKHLLEQALRIHPDDKQAARNLEQLRKEGGPAH